MSNTNSANINARQIDDKRTYRLATKLTAAARCATPTKYAMNSGSGMNFGTIRARLAAAVTCSPANAASAAATNTGPSAFSRSIPGDVDAATSMRYVTIPTTRMRIPNVAGQNTAGFIMDASGVSVRVRR